MRAYESQTTGAAARVLVDGLWPRGVRKADLDLHSWERAVAPSAELRKWFDHDPERFDTFRDRYMAELEDPEREGALRRLRALAMDPGLVIVTATAAVEISHAEVLRRLLSDHAPGERAARDS